jgi:hypothetical protein
MRYSNSSVHVRVSARKTRRTNKADRTARYAAGNRECADIVLSDPDRFPKFMQDWAAMVGRGDPRTPAGALAVRS